MKKLEEYYKDEIGKYDYELIVHDLIEWYGIQNKIDFCILAMNWSRDKLDKSKLLKEYNKQKVKS